MGRRTFKLKESILLHNTRVRNRNKESGKPSHIGVLTQQKLGEKIYTDSSYGSVSIQMTKMIKSGPKSIKVEYVKKICKILHVDENFLFGSPSKYDKEFQTLITEKS